MLNKKSIIILAILIAGLVMLGTQARADDSCEYQLTTAEDESGDAVVTIDGTQLDIEVVGARPNTLYTVWVDFRNRADPPVLSLDYQALVSKGALPRGVAPAFETTAGVTAGMGLDPNGFITDDDGNVTVQLELDYNVLQPGDSPVVGFELAMQGKNRVGGYWLRMYPINPATSASLQITDPNTGLPLLERATAQGITIVGHFDHVTHGHTPGVGDVDHFTAFKGDFPDDCLGRGPLNDGASDDD